MSMFELDAEHLDALVSKRNRAAKPSLYLAEVQGAIKKPDTAFGIAVPEGTKGSKIVSELHKGAAQLGVKLKVWNRESASKPFVGFKVKPVDAETPAE
jgi:hypothetical protein